MSARYACHNPIFNPESETMKTSDQTIESGIVSKGLTAPRITPNDLQANIVSEYFFTAGEGIRASMIGHPTYATEASLELLTFCVLVLRNGFTVTGESACASPENFNAEIGRSIARTNAVQKIWPLMGYQLKDQLYQRTQPANTPD